jgi:hypothetical protein
MDLTTMRRTCALAGATLLSAASLTVGMPTHAEAATGTFTYHPVSAPPGQGYQSITNPPASQCIWLGGSGANFANNQTNATATLYSADNCTNVLAQVAPGKSWQVARTIFPPQARSVKFSG